MSNQEIWEVQVKTSGSHYEISVIKKDNPHGHESWGWGGADKIILFNSSYGNTYKLDISDMPFMKAVAYYLCDALNKEGVTS